MDTTIWITVAVVVVIPLVAYRYREEIGVKFKGGGVQATLHAKGDKAQTAKGPLGGRNVSIGRGAGGNTIMLG